MNPYEVTLADGLWISDDPARLDHQIIHDYLSRSYWAAGIPRETVDRSIEHSLCFGVYQGARQVGFARVITDQATFAWLADVFILEEHRGMGLGKRLVAAILAHPKLQGLRRFMLATLDAHKLYEPFGFNVTRTPERIMEIHRPDLYKDGRGRGSTACD
jgi:GNAT superfamily N-acetyltransferase